MALTRQGSDWGFGSEGVTCVGIVEVTGYTARREFGTQVEGVGANGEIKAFLFGKEKYAITIEGYAADGELPEVGGAISLKGLNGTVMSIEVTGSSEDFIRCRVEGIAYPALQGGGGA